MQFRKQVLITMLRFWIDLALGITLALAAVEAQGQEFPLPEGWSNPIVITTNEAIGWSIPDQTLSLPWDDGIGAYTLLGEQFPSPDSEDYGMRVIGALQSDGSWGFILQTKDLLDPEASWQNYVDALGEWSFTDGVFSFGEFGAGLDLVEAAQWGASAAPEPGSAAVAGFFLLCSLGRLMRSVSISSY